MVKKPYSVTPSGPDPKRKRHRSAPIHDGLTDRQEAFAQAVVQGCNYSEAYRLAYSTANMKPETIWNVACVTAKKSNVNARILELVREREAEDNALDLTRRARVMAQFEHMMLTSASDSVKLRAAELLGKSVGVFDKDASEPVSKKDTQSLEKRLKELIENTAPSAKDKT